MEGMSFGLAPNELMAGAKNAVDVCLGVRAGEGVALIADEISRSVAASLELAIAECGGKTTGLLLEDFGPRPMGAAPPAVLDALEKADVGILCMTPQPGNWAREWKLCASWSAGRSVTRTWWA